MKNRTNINFENHILKISKDKYVAIYELAKPHTKLNSITFINSCGVLTVTGDYGNWVFCREFHPYPEESVSDGYWNEKLSIHSTQTYSNYDSELTEKALREWIKELKYNQWKELISDDEPTDDELEEVELNDDYWFEELLSSIDDELEYTNVAYRQTPAAYDYESIPFIKKQHRWLDAVYDAFDEMCLRIKNNNYTAVD